MRLRCTWPRERRVCAGGGQGARARTFIVAAIRLVVVGMMRVLLLLL